MEAFRGYFYPIAKARELGFPYKAPQAVIPIDVLLDRLEPEARKTIESLKLRGLYSMSDRSERPPGQKHHSHCDEGVWLWLG